MGSIQSSIECPNCNNEAIEIYDYKTGEEDLNCFNCGYHRSFHYLRGEDGKALLIDAEKGFSFDNLQSKETIIDKPFCAYRIGFINGSGQVGCFEKQEEYENFKTDIIKAVEQGNSNIAEATISRFVDGEIKVQEIYSNQNL
jgi:hypothetical protein